MRRRRISEYLLNMPAIGLLVIAPISIRNGQSRSRARLLACGCPGLASIYSDLRITASAVAQAPVNWTVFDSASVFDTNPTFETPLYAVNGGTADLSLAGIDFSGSNFLNSSLPTGVSFTPTGTTSSVQAGVLNNITSNSPPTDNSAYDSLTNSFSFANGTPSGITTGDLSFSGLSSGTEYQFQFWYNDQRNVNRVLELADSVGNRANLIAGTGDHGQFATGVFTATDSTQSFSLTATNFGNLHANAFLIRENTNNQVVAPPPAPRDTSGLVIDGEQEWLAATGAGSQFLVNGGTAAPVANGAVFESQVQQFTTRQRFRSLTIEQTPEWGAGQWQEAGNLGPQNNDPDAPVVLALGDGDYWYFNRAPGSGREYHGWHSTDLVTWNSVGNVLGTDGVNPGGQPEYEWTTSAEYIPDDDGEGGTFYLYYDAPNDLNPHLLTVRSESTGTIDLDSRVYHGAVLFDENGDEANQPGPTWPPFAILAERFI